MTPAETNTMAWRTKACRRSACKQPAGRRCIDARGTRIPPHPERLADLAVDLGAQLGELQQALDLRDSTIRNLTAELRTITLERGTLKAQNSDLARRVTEASEDLTQVRQQLTDALARIDELENPVPPPPPVTVQPLLIGAGGGNVDRSGDDSIDIDRPYYDLTDSDIAKLVARAKKNHAAGILTWATFKLQVSWSAAVTGGADAVFDRLVAACRALGFEIWIDLHHEPEGDGDPTVWAAFNLRLAKRLGDGKTGPVKFVLCVTGYSEEYGAAGADGSWDQLWPAGAEDYAYAIAYDNPYLRYGLPWKDGAKVAGGKLDTTWSEGKASYVDKLIARAKKLGVKAAIGECGYGDEAFAKDPAWLDRMFLAGAADEVLVAIVYFDSKLNSTRSWLLGAATSAKRLRFKSAAAAARAARAALR